MRTIPQLQTGSRLWFRNIPLLVRLITIPAGARVALVLFCLGLDQGSAETFRVLYSFGTNTSGRYPRSGLVQGQDGFLYGTTEAGGSAGRGQIFRLKPNGSEYSAVKDFTGEDGASPRAALVLSGTTLYGTTFSGGISNCGVIFRLQTDGSDYSVLRHFTGPYNSESNDGGSPAAGLTLAGNTLYGTTEYGGTYGYGAVFKVGTDGSDFALIKSFAPGGGVCPIAGLILSGTTLYGTTYMDSILGTVFKVNADGSDYMVLHNFSLYDGGNPQADLVISGSTLYGTTPTGGAYGYGLVFKINNDGTGFTPLKHFRGRSDGAAPAAGLTLWGSVLLGVTSGWSGVDDGTLFRLNTDGTDYRIFETFETRGDSWAGPAAGLLLSDGTLYGTTFHGGNLSMGSVFSFSLLPTILADPVSQTAEEGAGVQFRVSAVRSPLNHQWFFNGTNTLVDATNSFLILPAAESTQSGAYTVRVGNDFGFVTSAPAILSVIPPVERRLVPALILAGQTGMSLNLEIADGIGPDPDWHWLGSVALVNSPEWYFDVTESLPSKRFYRAGQTGSPSVIPALSIPGMVPALTLTGAIGSNVRVDAINQIGPTDAWFTLATVTMTNTTQSYFDVTAPGQLTRLYRLVPVP